MCSFYHSFQQRFLSRFRFLSPTLLALTVIFGASAQQAPLSSLDSNNILSQETLLPDNLSAYPPAQQLYLLGSKYPQENLQQADSSRKRQSDLIRSTVRQQAQLYAVPESVALGISGHESGGWTMWPRVHKKLSKKALFNRNYARSGEIVSTDWGVMQINDVAHPQAFPRARHDVEYNIAFGMELLAKTHAVYQGDLNMGFGVWDTTIAAYHLGHAPRLEEMAHARQYIQKIKAVLKSADLLKSLSYTVMPSDTLGRIAQKYYGDATQWERIWRKNRGQLNHPTQIRVGQTLTIPF